MMGRSYIERFDEIMGILWNGTVPTSRKAEAIAAILNLTPRAPPEVSLFQAKQLIELANQGLLTSAVQRPLKDVYCTLYNLLRPVVEQPFITVGPVLMSPYAGLGRPFGPELTFSHALANMSLYKNQPFSIVKVVAGGTQLYKDWSSTGGKYWNDMNATIHSLDATKDEWKGIVWFQGENDGFDVTDANNYLTNLTNFIDDLRREIHSANQVTTNIFSSYRDLPVTIVECGYWVYDRTPFGRTVMQAQRDFVASDDAAILVKTDDLARYSHYDEASPLIVGNRIAKAFLPLLQRAAGIITKAPSMPPTRAPTAVPSGFCFSGETTVQVKHKGRIGMKHLMIGDEVLVASGNYELVYSFGHRHEIMEGDFLQLLPSNLEISKDHMVMLAGGHFVPASLVQIGDELEMMNGNVITVEAIHHVVRTGVYAPFTMSGTIVVSDVKASSYIAFQDSPSLLLGDWKTPIRFQWMAHLSQAPHRLWIRMFGILEKETYTEEGKSTWVHMPHRLGEWYLEQHVAVMGILLIPMIVCLLAVSSVEVFVSFFDFTA
jgi:hypothetical protein